jgi:hypothetical protein
MLEKPFPKEVQGDAHSHVSEMRDFINENMGPSEQPI